MKPMKRSFMLMCLVILVSIGAAQAEEFNKFKFGVGLGFANSDREGTDQSFILALEPAWRYTDKLAFGFRWEGAYMASSEEKSTAGGASVKANATAIVSYTLNAQYYLSNGPFRPFVGVGMGFFNIGAVKIDATAGGTSTTSEAASASREFGYYPRVGFDFGHFNFCVDYNILPDTKADAAILIGTGAEPTFKNSYWGIKFGFLFGGGRISK